MMLPSRDRSCQHGCSNQPSRQKSGFGHSVSPSGFEMPMMFGLSPGGTNDCGQIKRNVSSLLFKVARGRKILKKNL
jgi:hypothetical protein